MKHFAHSFKFVDETLFVKAADGIERHTDFSSFFVAQTFSINTEGTKIVAILSAKGDGYVDEYYHIHFAQPDKQKLCILDLVTQTVAEIGNKESNSRGYNEVLWMPGQELIVFSDDNALWSIQADGSKLTKLANVKNTVNLTCNSSGNRLAFQKYKSDDKHLGTYDLKSGEITIYKYTSYSYDWLDDNRLVYFLSSGLKTINLTNGVVSSFVDQKLLLKLFDAQIESTDEVRIGQAHVLNVAEDRVYFAFSIIRKKFDETHTDWPAPYKSEFQFVSVTTKADDPQVHQARSNERLYAQAGESVEHIEYIGGNLFEVMYRVADKDNNWKNWRFEYIGTKPEDFDEGYKPVLSPHSQNRQILYPFEKENEEKAHALRLKNWTKKKKPNSLAKRVFSRLRTKY